jgi:excisionase family DNA binding protein
MTPTAFRAWINERLSELTPTANQPATREDAETVALARQYCFELGLLDFALSLPQEELKTPLACAIQLKRCRLALASPPDAEATEFLSIKQAAQVSNLSERMLYRLCASGDLNHRRIGKAIRIKRTDLEEYLAGQPSVLAAMGELFD